MFCDFSSFSQKSTYSKNGLKPSPEPHFRFAHAIAAFGMLLWLLTFFRTLTPALGFCSDCLQIPCETNKNACVSYETLACYDISRKITSYGLQIQIYFMQKMQHFIGAHNGAVPPHGGTTRHVHANPQLRVLPPSATERTALLAL